MNNYLERTRLYQLLKDRKPTVDPNATLWERSRLYHVLKEKGIIK
jgi:hypothetical protein